MKRFKEKAKAIWHIIKGQQYAVYVINNGYEKKRQRLIRLFAPFQIMLPIHF